MTYTASSPPRDVITTRHRYTDASVRIDASYRTLLFLQTGEVYQIYSDRVRSCVFILLAGRTYFVKKVIV